MSLKPGKMFWTMNWKAVTFFKTLPINHC